MTTVIRTPDISILNVLKPFPNFERVYQGQPVASNPIAIPGTLDFFAGRTGYDPNLLAGVAVPIGSDALLYIPRMMAAYSELTHRPIYNYTLIWRVRAQLEANEKFGLSGNLGQRLEGVPEQSGNSPGPRYVIPAAVETITFTNAEPADPNGIATQNVRSVESQIFGGAWSAPLSPNFPPGGVGADKINRAGIVSQGLYSDTDVSGTGSDYARAGWKGGPNYNAIKRPILGNELIILVSRESATETLWDFAGEDRIFSEFYGTANGTRPALPNVGIQLFTGSFAS